MDMRIAISKNFSRIAHVLTMSCALTITGCAGWQSQVETQVSKANELIETAKSAGAARLSPDTVSSAERYLSEAQRLLQQGNLEDATRNAQKASADATLALAQAKAAEKGSRIDTLRQEIASLAR